MIFSSPEPKAHGGAISIPIVVLLSVRQNPETFRHIELKFCMETHKAGNESLLKWSWSHDQDGHQADMW